MREDIQAVMELISERNESIVALEYAEHFTVDLPGAYLLMAHLEGADLVNSFLFGTNLSSAILQRANLSRAILWEANLSDTDLLDANLTYADLSGKETDNFALPATGLTQAQLDQARADPDNPPKLEGVQDAETGKPLVWRGKPLKDED